MDRKNIILCGFMGCGKSTVGKQLAKITGRNYVDMDICIEKKAYEQLSEQNQKDEFLTIHKTTDKLEYAKKKGAIVPEVYFLLSIIYNEAMHLDDQCKKLNPISYKLRNKVIHNMISEICEVDDNAP